MQLICRVEWPPQLPLAPAPSALSQDFLPARIPRSGWTKPFQAPVAGAPDLATYFRFMSYDVERATLLSPSAPLDLRLRFV